MDEFAKDIPEDKRAAFTSRLEQGTRWAGDHDKLTSATADHDAFEAYVREQAKDFNSDDIDSAIQTHGLSTTLKMIEDQKARDAAPAPVDDDGEVPPWAKSMREDMEAIRAERDEANKQLAHQRDEAKYNAEVGPIVEKAITDFGIGDDKRDAAVALIGQMCGSVYLQEVQKNGGDAARVNPTDVANHVVEQFAAFRGGAPSATPGAPAVTPNVTVTGKPPELTHVDHNDALAELGKGIMDSMKAQDGTD